jgi:hypothetical protein
MEATVAIVLAVSLPVFQSACALSGKPKTSAAAVTPPQPKPAADTKPAAPPEPLSVPQTQVQLPPPQPINPDAVPPPSKPEEPAPAPTAPRPVRRTSPQPTKPETSAPPAATPAEPELGPVQEVLTADERKRFQESADNRKSEIRHLLTQIKSHRLNAELNREVKRIQTLVAQSDDLEKHGDMRQADALAERGLILARELAGGK